MLKLSKNKFSGDSKAFASELTEKTNVSSVLTEIEPLHNRKQFPF